MASTSVSVKGSTEAALDVLMSKDGLAAMMIQAVEAATKRGKGLDKD